MKAGNCGTRDRDISWKSGGSHISTNNGMIVRASSGDVTGFVSAVRMDDMAVA